MDELPLPGGCVDRRGSPVEHGDRYTPEGKDPCEQCTCQRGRPDSCSITSCYPPAHCHQPYLRGSGECCDYACNGTTLGSPDGADVQSATTLGLRMVASTVASFLIVALLLFMIHRLRKRRLLVMIRRLNGCRAAASLEEACLARQLALEEQGVGFLGAFCPDPPPPYTFWKPPEAYVPPGEAPPPYDAPPVLLDRHQQEIVPTPVEPVPRVASVTPPLLCGGSSTSSEVGEPPQQQQRAIRSDAYYEDGLRHVTVVLVGDQAARRRLSHCEPSARRLVQDGDKRLSLQAPPPNQNNNVYPDPTSWAGEEEEGGSETTSSCTASADDRQGAFSPTSSESSASADVPEARQASQPAAVADPPKARRSLDRTLQRLKRFSMPKRKTSKKAATAGASSSAEGIATSCCLGHSSGMESDNSRTRGTKASDVCPQAVQQLPADGGACERLSAPTETQHSSSSHQDVGAVAMAGKPARKKAGKRKLFSLPSWDGSVLRRAPEGSGEACDPPCAQVVLESVVPAAEKVKDGTRPCSLDLPPASSTPKNHSSACPVVITVKCRPVRTEPPSAVSDQQTESPCSSSSASSKTDRQRTTEFAGVDPKPNGAVTVQPYAEAVHTIPRQSVARQVARLEAQGFRPPDASCATHMHSRSASHDNRCQERVHCKPREGQSFPQPGPF